MPDVKALRARIANEIWQSPAYQALVTELRSRRPRIPPWNPADDNTGLIHKALAQREWHDLMMVIIDLQTKEQSDE